MSNKRKEFLDEYKKLCDDTKRKLEEEERKRNRPHLLMVPPYKEYYAYMEEKSC